MRPRLLAAVAIACLAASAATSVAQEPAAPAPVAQPDREIEVAADAFVKDPRVPSWVLPHALSESRTAGPAVLRLLDHQTMVGDPTVLFVRAAVQIDDAGALTPLGRVPVAFVPAYQKVALHTLQVLRDGAVLDRLAGAQVRFLQRETGLERNVYSGVVTASILVDDLRVGDTLEVAYSLIGTNPVFGARYGGVDNWDEQLPVIDRRVVLNAPASRPIRWKFHGDLSTDFPRPVERVHDGIRSLVFEGHDLPRVVAEPLAPPGFNASRWVQFSEYADWPEVATWAASLFDADEAPDANRAAIVATLMAKPTVEERVVGALVFVQSEIRYFSVSLGTSSHRPAPPNTVLARRYGDCKDKSLLLVALLKDMGIASTPVLARLGNRRGFDDWLPTPLAFDHVIVAVDVDGRRHWLDPTRRGQYGALATMGQAHDGAEVLPAATGASGLQRIDAPDRDALALNELVETMSIPALDGDATLKVVQTLHGVAAENVRAAAGMTTRERADESMREGMRKRYPGATLVGTYAIDDDRATNRLVLTTTYTLTKPVEHVDGQYRVHFRPANFAGVFPVPAESQRRSPLALRFPVDLVYRLEVQFPDDVAVVERHETQAIDGAFFKATGTRTIVANHGEATLQLRTLTNEVAADDLPKLRDDLKRLDRTFPSIVAVRDTEIKKAGLLGLGTKDFAATLKDRQHDTVAKVTGALDSGRLSGVDLERAYCTRAIASATLGDREHAASDADRAVALDPNAVDALLCRARTRLWAGDFAAADDDASQAIVLGADGAGAWQSRGEARFHRARYADAASDFAKAASLDVDPSRRAKHEVWRAMALRRAKLPLPDDLAQRAAASRDEPWPRPALALFADRLDAGELAALAARRPGDEATMNGTEADFYIGEFELANGDVAKAREAFEATLAHGVFVFVEYNAAALELDRLRAAH